MKTIALPWRVLAPFFLLALPLTAQVIDQLKQSLVTASAPPAGTTSFASAVAIDSNIAVVGAPWTNLPGANIAGAVRVMYTNGVQIAYITNPSPSASAQFGAAVAISGNKVIVGAPYANTGVGTYGKVYVYDLASPTP